MGEHCHSLTQQACPPYGVHSLGTTLQRLHYKYPLVAAGEAPVHLGCSLWKLQRATYVPNSPSSTGADKWSNTSTLFFISAQMQGLAGAASSSTVDGWD